MLWFWVIVLVAIIGAIAVVAAGRGGSMADVYDDRPDASLPTGRPLTADDLRRLRLNTGVRGYRMDEVDALLLRLQAELLSREADEVRLLSHSRAEPEPAFAAAEGPEATEPTRVMERPATPDGNASDDAPPEAPLPKAPLPDAALPPQDEGRDRA